jgi:hypothetical protein
VITSYPIWILGTLEQHRCEFTQYCTVDHETAPVSLHTRMHLSVRKRYRCERSHSRSPAMDVGLWGKLQREPVCDVVKRDCLVG